MRLNTADFLFHEQIKIVLMTPYQETTEECTAVSGVVVPQREYQCVVTKQNAPFWETTHISVIYKITALQPQLLANPTRRVSQIDIFTIDFEQATYLIPHHIAEVHNETQFAQRIAIVGAKDTTSLFERPHHYVITPQITPSHLSVYHDPFEHDTHPVLKINTALSFFTPP